MHAAVETGVKEVIFKPVRPIPTNVQHGPTKPLAECVLELVTGQR
jgi:hypothetical protein